MTTPIVEQLDEQGRHALAQRFGRVFEKTSDGLSVQLKSGAVADRRNS